MKKKELLQKTAEDFCNNSFFFICKFPPHSGFSYIFLDFVSEIFGM